VRSVYHAHPVWPWRGGARSIAERVECVRRPACRSSGDVRQNFWDRLWSVSFLFLRQSRKTYSATLRSRLFVCFYLAVGQERRLTISSAGKTFCGCRSPIYVYQDQKSIAIDRRRQECQMKQPAAHEGFWLYKYTT